MSKLAKLQEQQQQLAQVHGVGLVSAESTPGFGFPHYKAAMQADLERLSTLSVMAEKIELKAELIKKYLGFVMDYIAKGEKYQNPIAVWLMIWLFDAKLIEPGLKIARHLIEQRIHKMPDNFKSNMVTFVCDYTYDWANDLLKKDQPASPYFEDLVNEMDEQGWDLAPPVQSKMYVMLAKHKEAEGDFKAVVVLCDKAIACNPEGHGTKTLRTRALGKL